MLLPVPFQLVSIYDSDRSKRIVACMRCLRATLTELIATVSSLDTSQINQDGLAELLELMASVQDIEKILYHVRKKGAGEMHIYKLKTDILDHSKGLL